MLIVCAIDRIHDGLNSYHTGQNGRHFSNNNFKCIFANENFGISSLISLTCIPRAKLAIVQHCFRQWLSVEQAKSHHLNQCLANSPTHICDTSVRWIKVAFCFRHAAPYNCYYHVELITDVEHIRRQFRGSLNACWVYSSEIVSMM